VITSKQKTLLQIYGLLFLALAIIIAFADMSSDLRAVLSFFHSVSLLAGLVGFHYYLRSRR
jgi:hypothetical protein